MAFRRWPSESTSQRRTALTFAERQQLRARISAILLERRLKHFECACCGRVLPRSEFHMAVSPLCVTCRERAEGEDA
jgi:hypothetical protein